MRNVILFALCFSGAAFATTMESVEVPSRTNRFSLGTGFEGRAREDVNPEVREGRMLPHFFTQYRRDHLGVALEGSYEERETSSGALNIESRSYQLGLWGRYEFIEPLHWSPFAGGGAGYFFDEVTSSFLNESDTRTGRRGFWGVSGGVSHAAFDHLLLEAEMRAVLVQDRKDASYSAIFRIGYVL